jgi:hypothetical protein
MDQLIRELTGPGGLLVALLVIIFTGMRGMWVFGWYVKEIKQDRDEWKAAALRATTIGERVVTVHEKEARDAST